MSVAAQVGLCLTLLQTPKTSFLMTRLNLCYSVVWSVKILWIKKDLITNKVIYMYLNCLCTEDSTLKILKMDTGKYCCNYPKIWIIWFNHRIIQPNDASWMANSLDPDQTAPLGHCWHWVYTVCPDLSVQTFRIVILRYSPKMFISYHLTKLISWKSIIT